MFQYQRSIFSPGFFALVFYTLLLSGCAHYESQPLDTHISANNKIPVIKTTASQLKLPGITTHPFNPRDGLDEIEIATLAVVNNPDLQALRAQKKISDAMVFSSGLLPDPQLSSNLDHPINDMKGLSNGWGLGLSYDVMSLLTRSGNIKIAKLNNKQIDLQLAWQEWLVAQKARTLYVQYQMEQQRLNLLQQNLKLFYQRYRFSSQAMKEGNLTLHATGPDLTALLDLYSQVSQLQRQHSTTRYDLYYLLGLSPQVKLKLSPLMPVQVPNYLALNQAEMTVTERRPDLVALQIGYKAQQAKVRQAILQQFPSITLGVNRSSDTSDVNTIGLGLSINLPVFNRNRGNIAIERATRSYLQHQYKARVLATQTDIDKLIAAQKLIAKQQEVLQRYLPSLRHIVDQARKAYENQTLDALTYITVQAALVNKQIEQLNLIEAQHKNTIALQTLLAMNTSTGTSP